MIIIVGCNKGGAGKTTTATNLAVAIARRGKEVCLVDADPQRSGSRWHAEREANGLQPAITPMEKRDNIASALKSLGEKYDYVLVDVAGRNSRELISGAAVANLIIAPHQASQLDLDTLSELQEQIIRVRDVNPGLRVFAYQTMASTNPSVKGTERQEFLAYLAEFPEIQALNSVGYYRKVYRDVIPQGKSVLEADNPSAVTEIEALVQEVLDGH